MFKEQKFHEQKLMMNVDGVDLPIAITSPVNDSPIAMILLIPGSLFNDVDGNYPEIMKISPHMYADLARQLSERGYTVLRYAKHGPGTGSIVTDNNLAATHKTFNERINVAKSAMHFLINASENKKPVFLAGHSEGSLVASLLAHQLSREVSGLICLSGPAYRFFDLLLHQAEVREQKLFPPNDQSRNGLDEFCQAIQLIREKQPLPQDINSNPHLAGFVHLDQDAWDYLREMDAVDPIEAIKRVQQPTLIVQGEMDESVFKENADLLNLARKDRPTEVVKLEGLQHFYKKVSPTMSAFEAFTLESESASSVANSINKWVLQLILEKQISDESKYSQHLRS